MEINSKWRIEADSMNIILLTPAKHEDGSDTFEAEAFFSTVGHALKYLVNREVKTTALKDLAAVNAKIEELHQLIDQLAISRWTYSDLMPTTAENKGSNELEAVTTPEPIKDTTTEDVTAISSPVTDMRACIVCGGPLPEGSRKDAVYCSGACRVKHHREQAVLF